MKKQILKIIAVLLMTLITQIPAYFIASLFTDTKISFLICFAMGSAWCHLGMFFNEITRRKGKAIF